MKNDFNIPGNFCSIQTKPGKIYITGGSKNENESLNSCFELIEGKQEYFLNWKTNMIFGRESHSLVALNAKYIYAIGSRIFK